MMHISGSTSAFLSLVTVVPLTFLIINSMIMSSHGFQVQVQVSPSSCSSSSSSSSSSRMRTMSNPTELHGTSQVEEVLASNYPMFTKLIMNKAGTSIWKQLGESIAASDVESSSSSSTAASTAGFTIFAPTDEAMTKLGEKKLNQLDDVRNTETAEKMATFHVINEIVTADALFNSGGVVTFGGVVDVNRSKSGGFMGFGGEEDGGVTINSAKILRSFEVGTDSSCVIHEVDALVSPDVLWRYVDQLRIPGSK
mmetsp:Transcript_21263/g.24602  ORF Transcript_21263/g.24602 Transcript_21263/m.24602 type:complete len:253 (+) Transcript_21263:284-1042(+)